MRQNDCQLAEKQLPIWSIDRISQKQKQLVCFNSVNFRASEARFEEKLFTVKPTNNNLDIHDSDTDYYGRTH